MNWPRAAPHTSRNAAHEQPGELPDAPVDGRVVQLPNIESAGGRRLFAQRAGLVPSRFVPWRAFLVNHRPRGYPAGLPDHVPGSSCPAGPGYGHILRPVLVVQERRRFYRESMTAFLRRQLGSTDVGDGVADAGRLMDVAERGRLDHAVIEADGVPWDVGALAAYLRRRHQDIQLIGLTTSSRPARSEGIALVPRNAPPDQVAKLVEPDALRATPFVLSVATGNGNGPLTDQQLRVLALLSLGLTVAGVAARLGLSERGVAKSKMAIFAKLGAQSQAQAVATALATGLLGPSTSPQQS